MPLGQGHLGPRVLSGLHGDAQHHRTNLHLIGGLNDQRTVDGHAIDARAVCAVEIFHPTNAARMPNPRMRTADQQISG